MGFVPPPIYEPGYPGGMGPNFKRWLKDRQRERMIGGICMIVGLVLMIVCLACGMAHGATFHRPLPQWLPGEDVVVWSKSGTNDAQTLEGTHGTVTDIGHDERGYWYDVNCQGWGDFRRYRENIVSRKEWEAMRAEFLRELNWPSWWMPLYREAE